jgi:hypothetical protein
MTMTQASVADWIEAIAQKVKLPLGTVQDVLNRYGVEPQATLPRRRRLTVRSVTLKGVKEGTAEDRPFDQTWTFGSGLWAILSDQNFRGKSSLLNIIQGGIRGDLPERIKPDVWRWLSHVEIVFDVNGVAYRLLVEKSAGEDQPKQAIGSFSREEDGIWLILTTGPLGAPLERTVEDVLMAELGFTKFHAFNTGGASHTHSWPAIASALFVKGPGNAIFGELTTDAMPLRLLQMFMGLPWISTYSAASTALKRVQAAATEGDGAPNNMRKRLEARLADVEKGLAEARLSVPPGHDRVMLRKNLVQRDNALVDLRGKADEARTETVALAQRLGAARTVFTETRRALQQLRDDRAAGVVLRTLRPVCCPSCDTGIDHAKYAAAGATDTCALCGTRHIEDSDEEKLRLDDLQADVADAEASVVDLEGELAASQARRNQAEAALTAAVQVIRSIEADLAADGKADLELEIHGLEAKAEQLRCLVAEEGSEALDQRGSDDEGVLKAAVAVTKGLYDGLAREILANVSREITRLSQRFGVENVESMDWGTGGALRIVQGGAPTSFTKLSPGENIRVRIAAALAVIEVSRQLHFGRHPGLLVLDSPAAQEMTSGDFAALLASVQAVIAQADDIQIIVGAVARPEVLDVVPNDRTTYAEGNGFLF